MKRKSSSGRESLSKNLYTLAATLFVIIAFRYIAADLIAPILLAAMFAVLLMPIFSLYRRRGFSRTASLVLMILTILLSAFALISLLQFSFNLIHDSISASLTQVSSSLENESLPPELQEVSESAQTALTPELVLSTLDTLMASFSNVFLYFLVIPILAVLIVSQVDSFSESFKLELGKSGPSLSRYKKFAESINAYITGRFKVNLATALMIIPALMFMGVDYAILWGLLALILGFIPYVGIFIAGAGPFFLMLANWGIAGGVVLFLTYVVITTITENFIDPLVQGRENRLTTTSLIIGFIFWSWLFGLFGTIIAAPLTVMLKTIFEDYKETRWLALLMMGDYSKTPKSSSSFKTFFGKVKSKLPKF